MEKQCDYLVLARCHFEDDGKELEIKEIAGFMPIFSSYTSALSWATTHANKNRTIPEIITLGIIEE
jgi:hypothetical protein